MLLSEFIERTGYQPTADEYAVIENEYNHFAGNKDTFCRMWKRVNPTKAGQIERAEMIRRICSEHDTKAAPIVVNL